MNYYPSKEIIMDLHRRLIQTYGGIDGLRDEGLLDSALNQPLMTFGGVDLYPTDLEKIARLSFGLIKNHAFIDGNKRIGAVIIPVILEANNIPFGASSKALEEIIFSVAEGRADYKDLLEFIIEYAYQE